MATVTEAWRAVFDGWDVIAVVGAVALIPGALPFFETSLLRRLDDPSAVLRHAISLALATAACAASAYVASHWHRFLLLGRGDVLATLPAWTRSETRLFWWYVGFGILETVGAYVGAVPYLLAMAFLEGVITVRAWLSISVVGAMVLLFCYLSLRCCLAFPAAAIGGPSHIFEASWRATAGNGWRLCAATALVLLPLVPPAWLGYRLSISGGLRALAGGALVGVSYLSAIVLAAGILSLAYRDLVLSRGTPEGESAEAPDQPDPAASRPLDSGPCHRREPVRGSEARGRRRFAPGRPEDWRLPGRA